MAKPFDLSDQILNWNVRKSKSKKRKKMDDFLKFFDFENEARIQNRQTTEKICWLEKIRIFWNSSVLWMEQEY